MRKNNVTRKEYEIITTACAPGKIILSGEHAVVYNKPILGMAVNRYVYATISERPSDKIQFEFLCGKLTCCSTLEKLRILRIQIDQRYQDFIMEQGLIKDVIHSPLELVQYVFIYLVEELVLPIQHELRINLESTLPIGCGMGASAAIILSLMHALVNHFGNSLTVDKYLHFGRCIENLQHGKSSGFDLFLSCHGGCYYFVDGNANKRNLSNIPLVLVNTGKPQTSTGECVTAVAKYLQNDQVMDDFAEVTMSMAVALQQNSLVEVQRCVRENHVLLERIGVVPKRVAQFISAVERRGNAAKISGAGAVLGDSAGIILVIGEESILDLIKEYDYEVLEVQGESNGLRIV